MLVNLCTFALDFRIMVKEQNPDRADVMVVGAGLTGLTTAYRLSKVGKKVHVVEQRNRVGGQIRTFREDGFVFESGPTTGSVSTPEVAELMSDLAISSGGKCQLETAPDSAKRRLIWKGDRFHDLPSGLWSAVSTPLFRFSDKIRILGEPWRKKGTDPDESVGSLARRRLGRSFVDYAVDPFLSGVYAGNPDTLVTRYALPKLYNLEQNHGSFIRGSIAKAKEPKTDRDRLATKKVFSAVGGLSEIPEAEACAIGYEHISLGVKGVEVRPVEEGWLTKFVDNEGQQRQILSRYVVTTCGAYSLPEVLPFVSQDQMDKIASLHYAPVMEVAVGIRNDWGGDYRAFGGLVPTCEHKKVLGILYPSSCFKGRAPQGGVLFSFFMGGVKQPELFGLSDQEVETYVLKYFHEMLKFPSDVKPDLIRIFRHSRAIPQYEVTSGARFEAVKSLQAQYPGLIIGGNLRDGIGMAHRITQAFQIASEINQQ